MLSNTVLNKKATVWNYVVLVTHLQNLMSEITNFVQRDLTKWNPTKNPTTELNRIIVRSGLAYLAHRCRLGYHKEIRKL